jgi:hypothetical protein
VGRPTKIINASSIEPEQKLNNVSINISLYNNNIKNEWITYIKHT